jgi:hypothetical protein
MCLRIEISLFSIESLGLIDTYNISDVFYALWLRRYATSQMVPRSIFGRVTGDIFRSIRQVNVPGVDSASKNEYQDIPGGKGGRVPSV